MQDLWKPWAGKMSSHEQEDDVMCPPIVWGTAVAPPNSHTEGVAGSMGDVDNEDYGWGLGVLLFFQPVRDQTCFEYHLPNRNQTLSNISF